MNVVGSAGERVRLLEQCERIHALIEALRKTIEMAVPCSENAQAVADAGIRIATVAGRHDAYQFIEMSTTTTVKPKADRVTKLHAALLEAVDIAEHFREEGAHPDDTVTIAASNRLAELKKT